MIVKKPGKYKLTEDWASRGSISIAHFAAGVIIEITQIDLKNRKVIGPRLKDWSRWDLPVEKIE